MTGALVTTKSIPTRKEGDEKDIQQKDEQI